MSRPFLGSLFILGFSVALALGENDIKQQAVLQRIQHLLDEQLVDTSSFKEEMPLGKFLAALEKQLPRAKTLALRIDEDAFGKKLDEVAATPMTLRAFPPKISLRRVLELAIATSKTPIDYRPHSSGVVVTTPERAVYVHVYDVRDLIANPAVLMDKAHGEQKEPPGKAALLVQWLFSALDQERRKPIPPNEAIQVQNGADLVIHTTAARHALIVEMLQSLRRLADVAVIVKAHLYEVDEAFFNKLKNAKYASREELERLFEKDPRPQEESLFKLLNKQKQIQAGEAVKAVNGGEVALLSRHQVVRCLAGPEEVRRGDKERQAVLEGVSFLANIQVSSDRRFVRLKVVERAAHVEAIDRVKVWDPTEKEEQAEAVVVKETTQSQVRWDPDGGTLLLPVQYRPAALRAKGQWWVLRIDPRIYIEDEEKESRKQDFGQILPLLIADVLKNPRLKSTRDFYGSPDDKHFALVESDTWTWPEKDRLDVPGYQLVPTERKGKRLLGIRLDKYVEAGKDNRAITVTLINAGGSANGTVIGGGTIRYTANDGEKGWVVGLDEPAQP